MSNRASYQYRPELDGIRAIAIGFVLANHVLGMAIGWDRAGILGWVGVTLFFGLSGYLITGILLNERERTGTIALRAFYWRRFARLAPALVAMLAFVLLTGLAGGQEPGWQTGLVGAVTYSSNWLKATGVELGSLTHTWTLAVEEQFYFVWPLALVLLPKFAGRIATLTIVVGLAAYVLLPLSVSAYVTPAGGVALMAGALLAMKGVGSSKLARLGVLAPMGKRAYSLYLWNWPLTMMLGPLGGFLATFAVAELSYRLVERPMVGWAKGRFATSGRVSPGQPSAVHP